MNDDTADEIFRKLVAARPAAELPPAPDPAERARLLEALASDRPITVIFHGEMTFDAAGDPLAVTPSRAYEVGEAITVLDDWTGYPLEDQQADADD